MSSILFQRNHHLFHLLLPLLFLRYHHQEQQSQQFLCQGYVLKLHLTVSLRLRLRLRLFLFIHLSSLSSPHIWNMNFSSKLAPQCDIQETSRNIVASNPIETGVKRSASDLAVAALCGMSNANVHEAAYPSPHHFVPSKSVFVHKTDWNATHRAGESTANARK